jgi:biopolymer transport protein ExbB
MMVVGDRPSVPGVRGNGPRRPMGSGTLEDGIAMKHEAGRTRKATHRNGAAGAGRRRWPVPPPVLVAAAAILALMVLVPATLAVPSGDAASVVGGISSSDSAGGGRSFASAFFIARKLGDGTDSQVELLGSAVIWLLLLLSVGGLGMIGHLAAANRRKVIMPEATVGLLKDQLRAGRYREAISEAERDGSFFAEVLASALREASHGWEAMIHALDQRTDELVADRQRKIEVLNVLGQVSPMIGLFGTVYGMILAFQSIVSAGGSADPVMLAGGIGTALTTTFWGLIVAIPALTGYAVVRSLMDARTAEAALAAEEIVGLFRPRPRRNGGSADGGGGGSSASKGS